MEKYAAFYSCNLTDFYSFASNFLNQLQAEVLVHGNITSVESKEISRKVLSILQFHSLAVSQSPNKFIVKLENQKEYIFRQHSLNNNKNEINSAVENIYIVTKNIGFFNLNR